MTRTFDRADAGTPAAAWRLADVDPVPIPYPGDRVIVLAAHPDDETLGAGGLVASLARRGVDVTVAIATDGEASHPGSPTRTPAELARIRRAEVQRAVRTLAPDAGVAFLGLPDGGLDAHERDLSAHLARLAGAATHVISPWTGDRHPDHEACGRAAAQVSAMIGARHWQYPIWAWHWADPATDDLPLHLLRQLPLSADDAATKRAALACHTSQHAPLSDHPADAAVLSPAMLAHFRRDAEYFVITGARATSAESFDSLYETAADPWNLQDAFYEQRKREIEFASLPRRRFRRAFEPGCAVGLLTEHLAQRCDEVTAWDVAERSLEQARARTAGSAHVRLELRQIPDDWPDGEFDLIVLSEVGYYCVDLEQLVDRVTASLAADGVVLACHWRRPAPDHPHTAEAVHGALACAGLHRQAAHVEDDFLLDVWSRTTRSVAQADGVIA